MSTPSARERALQALLQALEAHAWQEPKPRISRDQALPERVPAGGLITLYDGEQGEPVEVLLSPRRRAYEHVAELQLVVQSADASERTRALDRLVRGVTAALAVDLALGGAVDWAEVGSLADDLVAADGEASLKAGTLPVTLAYDEDL